MFLITLTNVIWGGSRVLAFEPSLSDECNSWFFVFTSIHLYIQLAFAALVGCLILILILAKGWAGIFLACCPRKLVACKRVCAKKRLRSTQFSANGSILEDTRDYCQKHSPGEVETNMNRLLDRREPLLPTGPTSQKKLE